MVCKYRSRAVLLDRGADINARSNDDRTPLHNAAQDGNIQVVLFLLEHGADVNARDNLGDTPSKLGSDFGQHEIVELLSKYGADAVK